MRSTSLERHLMIGIKNFTHTLITRIRKITENGYYLRQKCHFLSKLAAFIAKITIYFGLRAEMRVIREQKKSEIQQEFIGNG